MFGLSCGLKNMISKTRAALDFGAEVEDW